MTTPVLIAILLVVLILVIAGLFFYMNYRKKQMHKMFEQIADSAKQVPKQKRYSFILFMFKESVFSSKKKKATLENRMNNPKFVETQILQMDAILKNPSKVTDKKMKQALRFFDAYVQWEKKNFANVK